MNIWIASAITSDSYGGIMRSMWQMKEGLIRGGHKVVIIYKNSAKETYLQFAFRLFIQLITSGSNAPDWIITRSTDGVLCGIVTKIARLKTKIILHSHGWEEKVYELEKKMPIYAVHPKTTWKAHIVRFPLLRLMLNVSTCCLCGTHDEARWVRMNYPRYRKKIRVFPNGIDVPKEAFWYQKNSIPKNILIVGGTTWKKNVEYGIRLFRTLLVNARDCRLFILGIDGQSEFLYRNAGIDRMEIQTLPSVHEERRIVPWEIHDENKRFILINKVHPSDMSFWYRFCPYLIAPSRYEGGHSFAILEALAHGMIVFASGIPSTKEIVKDRKNGVLISGCDLEWDKKRMLSVIKNPESVKMYRYNAWRTAQRHERNRHNRRIVSLLECRWSVRFKGAV